MRDAQRPVADVAEAEILTQDTFVKGWLSLAGYSGRGSLGGWLARWIDTPSISDVVAFTILFVSTVVLGGLVNLLAGQLVAKTGLTATDRALGMVFGIARGVVIVAVLVLLAGLTTLPQDPWWSESVLLRHFQDLALWLRSFLPPDVAGNIHY